MNRTTFAVPNDIAHAESAVTPGLCLAEDLLWLTPTQRHARVVEAIKEDVSALLLLLNPDVIDAERPLHRYGLDAVGAEMVCESLEVLLDTRLSRELDLQRVSAQVVASWALPKWFESRAHWRPPNAVLH